MSERERVLIEEPPLGTIVCWFDNAGDLYAAYQSTVSHLDADDGDNPHRWLLADGGLSMSEPCNWPGLLEEMEGFRGPIELTSNGRLEPTRATIAEEDPHRVMFDVVEDAPDGLTHTYWSTHCRHDRHDDCSATAMVGLDIVGEGFRPRIARMPTQCKTCSSPCICPCHAKEVDGG